MTAPYERISIEQVARYPRPGMGGPMRWSFTPDGSGITYLASEDGGLVRSLWLYDIARGERRALAGPAGGGGPISREEELRRERARLRDVGVTDYRFATKAPERTILLPGGEGPRLILGEAEPVAIAGAEGGDHTTAHRRRRATRVRAGGGAVRDAVRGRGSAAAHERRGGRFHQRARGLCRAGGVRPAGWILVVTGRFAHRVRRGRRAAHPGLPDCPPGAGRARHGTPSLPVRGGAERARAAGCGAGGGRGAGLDGPRRGRGHLPAPRRVASGRHPGGSGAEPRADGASPSPVRRGHRNRPAHARGTRRTVAEPRGLPLPRDGRVAVVERAEWLPAPLPVRRRPQRIARADRRGVGGDTHRGGGRGGEDGVLQRDAGGGDRAAPVPGGAGRRGGEAPDERAGGTRLCGVTGWEDVRRYVLVAGGSGGDDPASHGRGRGDRDAARGAGDDRHGAGPAASRTARDGGRGRYAHVRGALPARGGGAASARRVGVRGGRTPSGSSTTGR